MARIASDYTLACRNLFSENPDISFKDALPKLKADGYDLPDDYGDKSEDLKAFDKEVRKNKSEHVVRLINDKDLTPAAKKDVEQKVKALKSALEFSNNRFNTVLEEWKKYDNFRRERMNFDVIRSQWKKRHSPSAKPSSSDDSKAKTAKIQKNSGDLSSKIELVKSVMNEGGIAAIRQRLTEIRQQLTDLENEKVILEAKLAACEEVGEMLTAA